MLRRLQATSQVLRAPPLQSGRNRKFGSRIVVSAVNGQFLDSEKLHVLACDFSLVSLISILLESVH